MPITSPSASSSGPPELPGLIEASVWIAPSIWNWVSDSIERSVAETIAGRERLLLAERAADRGDGRADRDVVGVAELERLQVEALGVDLDQRDVGVGVEADDLGRAPGCGRANWT